MGELRNASNPTRVFLAGDDLYITLDQSTKKTSIIRINLADYQQTVVVHDVKAKHCVSPYIRKSSFILEDKLFQLISCTKGIDLSVRNLSDGKILKEYTATEDEEIMFKNSALIQKSLSSFAADKEKEITTSRFLKKTSNAPTFITVSAKGKNFLITLGGFVFTAAGQYGNGTETLYYFTCELSKETLEHVK
jgi:hypothetical protein